MNLLHTFVNCHFFLVGFITISGLQLCLIPQDSTSPNNKAHVINPLPSKTLFYLKPSPNPNFNTIDTYIICRH